MPETAKLMEQIADAQASEVAKTLASDEEILILVSTDLDGDGRFGGQWLVVTDKQVVIARNGTAKQLIRIPLSDIRSAATEALVGGGRLEIERFSGPTIKIPYSRTEEEKLTEVARGIEQLRDSEALSINTDLSRTRCQQCGRLLPEKNGICPACISRLTTLHRIAKYMMPYRGRVVVLGIASVIATASELLPALVVKRIVDEVLVPVGTIPPMDERLSLLGFLVLALIGIRLVSWGAEWTHGWIVAWLGAQVTADIRSQLYRRLEMLSLQFYDKRKVGALMSRVTRDTGGLQEFLVDGLPYLIINVMMIVGILAFLFGMSVSLSLYMLMPVPLIVLWGAVFWKRMRRHFGKWNRAWSKLTERTNEALSGIRVVKAFAQEKREIESFDRINARARQTGVETELNRGIFFETATFLTGLGVLVVWYFGGGEVLQGRLTLGTLLAFYSYMWLVYGPLQWFSAVNSWMSQAFAGAERIFEVIDTEPEAYSDPNAVAIPDIKGQVTFRNVSFGYDKSKPVLHDINLDVKPGEMIGIVGRSGVGKTTTVNLTCRFYDVDRGAIEIDGVDLRQIRLQDIRSQIGIVLQEPVLFSGTIAENISYGDPQAYFSEVIDAAKSAHAHNFIVAKPDGYDTQVGDQGNNLSGGEKQRISIARAILHNPRVLILDEATSSVDVETEKQIQEALGRLVKGRTTFAIAHRLSTLRNADRLVVLDDGRVVEVGTHAELMTRNGAFADLVRLQQEAAQIIAIKD